MNSTNLNHLQRGLSERSLELLSNPNPYEIIINQTDFVPVYDSGDTNSIETNSSIQHNNTNNGMKRKRSFDTTESTERNLKRVHISRNDWHMEYIPHESLEGYSTPNPKFIPKYISDRIPIPMPILSDICNNYLNTFDKRVIKGEFILITSSEMACLSHNIVSASKATGNAFYLATRTPFWQNANSPEYHSS
nr:hypothetical protein [Cressdnaviricota sp.]